jgi:Glycosyl transferase family 2
MTTNVFACLVHEAPDCVVDLVSNLRCLDPESVVLLYDGSAAGGLLRGLDWIDPQVRVVPGPQPMRWGRLHDFALDTMRYALDALSFEALTIVDSDQLLLRHGYSERVRQLLADHPGAGCFGSAWGPLPHGTNVVPAAQAWDERDTWLPYLERAFPGRADLFPHWTFWPSTVFTAEACRRLTETWTDPELRRLADGSRIMATEEVLLPTVTALCGLDVVRTPLRQDLVSFRRAFPLSEVERMADHPDAFWVHPALRLHDDPLRSWIRDRFGHYREPTGPGDEGPEGRAQAPPGSVSGLMVTRDRPHEAAFAVQQWVAQDHLDRELVVVDDGDIPVEEVVRSVPGVVYVRPALRAGRAAARNLAASHARGEFFAHWDESGWNCPTTLSGGLRVLAEEDADLCGRRSFAAYDPSSGRSWTYEYPRARRLWLADFTLLYRRGLWDAQSFSECTPDAQIGFYWPARARRAVALTREPPPVSLLTTTAPVEPWWRPLPDEALPRLLGRDWSAYVATREPA